MTDGDKQRFAALMASLGLAFDALPPREKQALYWDALRDLSVPALEFAVREAIKSGKWFPRAAELREWALSYRPPVGTTAVEVQRARLMIEDLTPPEVARERLADLAARLNGLTGTAFGVGEELGRPVLVSLSGGRRPGRG